ncbi:protein kinase domain-containing protein [Nephila pilipes]|uniref:Protein kinase domain-containing protein n=1 Tax=Nephila pilipes TaxID=299642 RepID=A0A8X6NT42_NEPPI|nr:protein kinase domain-containing protein [Nephila pilipes]
MSKQMLKPSELKAFLKFEGSSHYKLKHFIDIGDFTSAMILDDVFAKNEKVGKIVTAENEEEFFHWPKLHHENLIRLLDIVPLDYQKAIFIFTFYEKSLRSIIKDISFLQHPKCFDRKKSYARNILCGLEYLHQISLSLMNLNDQNIMICSETDKAIISDFSCIRPDKFIAKSDCQKLSTIIAPPEFSGIEEDREFECKPVDMWCCGITFLQMFTMHGLPWCTMDTNLLEGLDMELLKQTNIGSQLQNNAATSLKEFLELFLQKDPKLRISATAALVAPFFHKSDTRLDEEARVFWKACELAEVMPDNQSRRVGILQDGTKKGFGDILFRRKYFQTLPRKTLLNKEKFIDIHLRKVKSNPELCMNKYSDTMETECELHGGKALHKYSNESLKRFCDGSKTSNLKSFVDFYPRMSNDSSTDTFFRPISRTQEEKPSIHEPKNFEEEIWENESTIGSLIEFQSPDRYWLRNTICKDDKYSDETKSSQPQNISFGLTCRCISCKYDLDLEDTVRCIQPLPLGITDVKCNTDIQKTKQLNISPFFQIQGGFLHNKWKIERNNRKIHSSDQPLVPNYQKNPETTNHFEDYFCEPWNTNRNNPIESLLGNTPTDVALPFSVQNPFGFIPGLPNQEPFLKKLMFQRATGFRSRESIGYVSTHSLERPSKNINQTWDDCTTVISPTSGEDTKRIETKNSLSKYLADTNAVEKVKSNDSSKVKETLSNIPSDYVSDQNETEDIFMERPLCSKNLEDKLGNKSSKLIVKSKLRWLRVLCPGSRTESTLNLS